MGEASSPLGLSMTVGRLGDLGMRPEENTSSTVVPTDGRVLWDRSQPATDEETLTRGAGLGEMEMDAGVALTTTGAGGGGAGGLGARCLMDLEGAGGWGSADSGSLVVTEVSCRKTLSCLVYVELLPSTRKEMHMGDMFLRQQLKHSRID